jgi:hypothetical protein
VRLPASPHKPRPLRTSSRRLWTAVRITALSRARSAPTSLSPQASSSPNKQPQALDCCQHYSSLWRTECAYPPLPTRPLRTSSRRLWTAVSITALSRARSAPTRPRPTSPPGQPGALPTCLLPHLQHPRTHARNP